jgi:hypothetical protein
MKFTKRQLRRIIREEAAAFSKKYDEDSALKGKQSDLPDNLQKAIIDKTVEDREEQEEEVREEKNETIRLPISQLRAIILEVAGSEDYQRGLEDGREDQAAEEMGGQVYGPENPETEAYMLGYEEGFTGLPGSSIN